MRTFIPYTRYGLGKDCWVRSRFFVGISSMQMNNRSSFLCCFENILSYFDRCRGKIGVIFFSGDHPGRGKVDYDFLGLLFPPRNFSKIRLKSCPLRYIFMAEGVYLWYFTYLFIIKMLFIPCNGLGPIGISNYFSTTKSGEDFHPPPLK